MPLVKPAPIPNNSARLIVYGHSYAAPYLGPYGFAGSTFDEASGGLDGARFPALFANLIGVDMTGRMIFIQFPGSPTSGATVTCSHVVPEEGLVEGIYFMPAGGLTGANTNSRDYRTYVYQDAALHQIHEYCWVSGTAAALGQALRLFDISNAQNNALEAVRVTSGTLTSALTPRTTTQGAVQPFSNVVGIGWTSGILFQSVLVGTGVVDPGGTIAIRYGGTFRNLAVGGSRLLRSGVYHGGWAAMFQHRAPRHTYGPEVIATPTSNSSATTLTFQALEFPIPSGWKIAFSNGVTATTTANANVNATSVACSALSGAVPAGEVGTARSTTANGYQSLTPHGLHLLTWGRNDAILTGDRPAWRESHRAVIALALCPYFQPSDRLNQQASTGTGNTTPSWTTGNTVATAGQFITPWKGVGTTILRYTGGANGSPTPSITIKTPPAFEGGTIDLFFAAQAGASKGGAAAITVDGSNPPSGACTINTSGVCTNDNVLTGFTGTLNGSTTLTFTAGTLSAGLIPEIGMAVSGTGGSGTIAKGSKISAITSTTVCTLDTAGTANAAGGITVTLSGYIPMVKRLTGLAAGAHTILISLTAMDANDQSAEFIYLGYGIEASVPSTPVIVSGIARAPADTSSWTNVLNYNTDTQAVIAGTAAAPTGNSTEPAMPSSVIYVDTDAPLNGANSNVNFGPDGVHPNAEGHNILSRTFYRAAANAFTSEQLIAR